MKASLFPKDAVFQCLSPSEPFYAKIKHIYGTSRYELFAKEGIIEDIPIKKETRNEEIPAEQGTNSQTDLSASLSEKLKQKFASQMSNSNLGGSSLLQVVSKSVPHAVMDTPENSLNVYWVTENGACENLAIVATSKMSKNVVSIENYLRCSGKVKQLPNTSLPVVLPDSLKSKQSDFIQQIKNSGSIVFYDTLSGITALGRKERDTCSSTLFYIKNNSLLHVVNGGC